MIDQMPDEVWLDEDTINGEFYASPQQAMVTDVRYIRADLCEQAEAKRDRLRAALERLMRGEGGVNSLEQERIAQEALSHD